MRKTAYLVAALALSGTAANAAENPLAPMSPWAGHCWKGVFADGKQTDTHCFTWVYQGQVLRDRHVVNNPGKPDYIGETVYFWDSAASKIGFFYYENAGGISRGTVEPTADGLTFPATTYSAPGEAMTYRVRWTRQGDQAYEAWSEAQAGDKWVTMFKMTLKAEPTSPQPSPP